MNDRMIGAMLMTCGLLLCAFAGLCSCELATESGYSGNGPLTVPAAVWRNAWPLSIGLGLTALGWWMRRS